MMRHQVTLQLTVEVTANTASEARDEAVEVIACRLEAARPTTNLPKDFVIQPLESESVVEKLRRFSIAGLAGSRP